MRLSRITKGDNKMGQTFKDVMRQKQERAERETRPKVEWFSLKNGETKYIRFLQELDTDMRNYDSKFGTAVFLQEHIAPDDWSRKALCTIDDEGRCFGCEMNKEVEKIVDENGKDKWRPWAQKSNFYIYTVDNKGAVKVLSRPTGNKLFDRLTEEVDENDNSLTDITFKLSKGPNKSDAWEVRKTTKEHFELPDIPELVDLNAAVGFKVPYADQRSFYLPNNGSGQTKEIPTVSSAATSSQTVGEDW
jgi:hypothetical protein